MKFTFIYFLLTLFVYKSYSQNEYKLYHQLILKAQNQTLSDSVVFYYEKAFSNNYPFPEDLRNVSYLCYKNNQTKLAEKYFFESIKYGLQVENDKKNDTEIVEYDFGYVKINDTIGYLGFLNQLIKRKHNKIKRLRDSFLKKTNTDDNIIFEKLLQNEMYFQKIRFSLENNINTNDTICISKIFKYSACPNSYYALKLLTENSFPIRKNCKRFNNHSITILLNHIVSGFLNIEDAKNFIEKLWRLVELGSVTPEEYAFAYDHFIHHFVSESKGYFGTMLNFSSDGKLILEDLLEPTKVNEIRNKYWNTTIESFCEKRNCKLPSNYEK
jgi:hypothetical protein